MKKGGGSGCTVIFVDQQMDTDEEELIDVNWSTGDTPVRCPVSNKSGQNL